jgi:hypothetical protein
VLSLLVATNGVDLVRLGRILRTFLVVSLLAEAVEILLYLGTGRLPALAYAGTVSIRFGSIWDDPNGFAIMIAALIPIAVLCFSRMGTRVLLVAALLVSLVLTQSLTGIIAVLLAVVLATAAVNWRSLPRIATILSTTIVGVIIIGVVLTHSSAVDSLLYSKQGSIGGHLDAFSSLRQMSFLDLLGVTSGVPPVESGLVHLVETLGIPFVVLYVTTGLAAIKRYVKQIQSDHGAEANPARYALLVFLIAYLLGLVNTGFDRVFPLNLLYGLAIALSLAAGPPQSARQRGGGQVGVQASSDRRHPLHTAPLIGADRRPR